MSAKVDAYEKLGAFYLGRPCDPETGAVAPVPLLYDSKDLVTHAVCVGMTGSGKTGLCIGLLEEAAIDGIPALVIDVKGDLGNLLLTFPELRGEDFRPWIDEDEARREGVTPDEFAARQAALWRQGLADWDQEPDRIRRLRDSAEFAIYTPGSVAGWPVSIVSSFDAPSKGILEDSDALADRISTTSTSLLGLLGIDADPIRSREHILISNLLGSCWREGKDLGLEGLILGIQKPPFDKVGMMSLESFYPEKERFQLAMAINNLLAAPTFQGWLTGEPLDVGKMLFTAEAKPRVAIFTVSHLNDAERMFFVSLLLNQTLSWMRGSAGTSSLRAILYMDEIFGYLPPVANPPSKGPLLTMLKQARAFGLGLVLATQNPVDLDYKALSNIGTWFIGRLQTRKDQERILVGLEGAQSEGFRRKDMERLLAGLGKRTFLLHNVHEDEPVLFRTRWVLSYLRGPLTRDQIERLKGDAGEPARPAGAAAAPPPVRAQAQAKADAGGQPLLPPEVEQRFLPPAERDGIVYRPHLLGAAKVHFVDTRKGLEAAEELVLLAPLRDGDDAVDWDQARDAGVTLDRLDDEPADGAAFAPLPAAASDARSYSGWSKALADALYRGRSYELSKSPTFDLISKPGESERDFRIRLADVAHEKRDEEIDKLRDKYAKKISALEERIRRAEQKIEKERDQAGREKLQTAVSIGTTLLGALFGRRRLTGSRIGTATRGIGRSFEQSQDVSRAEHDRDALVRQLEEMNRELEQEIAELGDRYRQEAEELETFALKPRRSDVDVRLVALAWVPDR
jgi:hypothetical protein